MAHGGEAATAELGAAGAAQTQGGDLHINPAVFDNQLAAGRDGGFYGLRGFQLGAVYGDPGVFERGPRPGAGRGDALLVVLLEDPNAAYDASGNLVRQARLGADAVFDTSGVFTRQPRPVVGRAEELLCVLRGVPSAVFDTSGNVARQASPVAGRAEELFGVLRGARRPLFDTSGEFTRQPLPVVGRAQELLGVLGGAPGAVLDSSGNFAREARPGAGHDGELLGLVLDNPGNFSRESLAGAGRAAKGIVNALRDSNLGTVVGSSGTMAEHLRRCLPVVGILASSAAVNGLAAGAASPAAGFGFFALLLGGLSLVTFHVLRA